MSIIKETNEQVLGSEFQFNPVVKWAYTNGIVVANLMPGQRNIQRRNASSELYADLSYNRAWTELAEMSLCLSMHTLDLLIYNKLIEPFPPGFDVTSGTVTCYNPREHDHYIAYHTWLQRTQFDGSIEILDFFASQFMFTPEQPLIAGERRMELKRRVRESNAPIIYAELGSEWGILPFILGTAEDFQKDLQLTYVKGGNIPERPK